MIIDWPASFNAYLDRLETDVAAGRDHSRLVLDRVTAALQLLQELDGEPTVETPSMKVVRQSRQNRVWRVAHPYHPEVAVRVIAWFPPERPGTVVVALFAGDKAGMGDVFYDSVGNRADAAIAQWRQQEGTDDD